MVHVNQKCFSTQIWTFIVIVPWINIHANSSLWYVQVQLAITYFGLEGPIPTISIAFNELFHIVHLSQVCSTRIWMISLIVR